VNLSRWRQSKLNDITDKDRSITYGVVKPGALDVNGVRFIRGGDIFNGKINIPALRTIKHEISKQYKRTLLQGGELLISLVGNPGEVAIAPKALKGSNIARQVGLVALKEDVHPSYVMYFLMSSLGRKELFAQTTGSVQRVINLADLKNVRVPIPPLPTQRKIAGVLSAYDDLIENNSRRIAILEEMAQAIYREWFVNFRFPGHENVKLIDSPLGKIPDGWKVQNIESTLSFQIGGGWGQEQASPEFPNPAFVIRGTDIPDARSLRVVNCPLRFHTDSNIRTRKLQANDLVFEVSGGSKGQPVGRCLFVSERLLRRFDNDLICASFCKLIRANTTVLASEILYHYVLDCYSNGTIEQYEVQSTGIKNFKFTVFIEKELLSIPPCNLQKAFVSNVRPILETIHIIGKKNEILRSTRDLLLPKLISGQLDVEDLDIDIGEQPVEATT
jgi:type I restriction enzyme S subunit